MVFIILCHMNSYRVIDLGVMCPCEKILETAIAENAGMMMFAG